MRNKFEQPLVEVRLVCCHCVKNTARYCRLRPMDITATRTPDPFPTACALCAMKEPGEYAQAVGFNPLDYTDYLLHPQLYCPHNDTTEPAWMCTECYDVEY